MCIVGRIMECNVKKSHEGTFYLCHCVTLLFVIELTPGGEREKGRKICLLA